MDIFGFFGDVVNRGVVLFTLVLVSLIKKTCSGRVTVPAIVWRWAALVLAAVASLVLPVDGQPDPLWRFLASRALVYAGASLILYNVVKDPGAYFKAKLGSGPPAKPLKG